MPTAAASSASRTSSSFTRKWILSLAIIILFTGSSIRIILNEQQLTSEWLQQQLLVDKAPIADNKPIVRIPKRSPRRVYWCGFGNLFDGQTDTEGGGRGLAEQLFPEVEIVHINKKDSEKLLKNTTVDDVLLYGGGDLTTASKFPGTIVILNGESRDWWKPEVSTVNQLRVFPVAEVDLLDEQPERRSKLPSSSSSNNTGIIGAGDATSTNADVKIYFMSMHFATLGKNWQERVLRQSNIPNNSRGSYDTKPYFLLYVQSNCVRHREKAFGELSKLFNEQKASNGQQVKQRRKVHYGQNCAGRGFTDPKNVEQAPSSKSNYKWTKNYQVFQNYRFGLVMENTQKRGYMTEKIINAFVSGTIPIYYGSKTDVLEVFHPEAFVYWDLDNPQPAIERIRYLETNKTAYNEVLKGPILRQGHETIRNYFSWNDDLGNGKIKWFIRDRIGYG